MPLKKKDIKANWTKATHPIGITMDLCKVSPQYARVLMDKAGHTECKLPSVGCMHGITDSLWVVNRGGQYEIECIGETED